jgi:uncharacterized protein (DUF488 family)
MRVFTLGHGTASEVELAKLLRQFGVGLVCDVRSVPRSRAHPHVWAERMADWVPRLGGARYEWVRALGGFRKPRPDSPNVALRHASFRGYADYMQTQAFLAALDRLLEEAATAPTAIMCSESLWWRCHRRLIADAMTLLHRVDVKHILHSGTLQPHFLTEGVRVTSGCMVQYDAAADV